MSSGTTPKTESDTTVVFREPTKFGGEVISIEAENAMEDLVLLDCWPLYVPAAGDPAFHLAARVGKPGLLDDIRTMIEQGLITVDLPESDDLNSDSLVRRCRLTTA